MNRTIVDTTALPAYVGDAVVASEDRRFYYHDGVDWRSAARASFSSTTATGTITAA